MEGPRTIVALAGVTKRYDDVLAVDRLDLDVHNGEFLALLGPSGCGKTTTLRMIAGFEQPTEGEIVLDGAPVVGVPPHKRQVNTVFQQYALFPHMSVLDNVAYGLKQRGVGRRERREEAARMLASVHLEGREQARPNQLSGGQQQRVALARALVMRPKVLLLDEPLGSLDQKLRKAMQIELKRLQAEVGITFVFVTHDQDEAMTMADRIAVMDQGRIEQLAVPSALYDEPATEFVAHFIGDLSELQGALAGDEVALDGGGRVPVGRRLVDVANGARVRVGLRPEGAAVAGRSESDGPDVAGWSPEAAARGAAAGPAGAGQVDGSAEAAAATVVTAMVLGDRLQLVVRLGDGQELLLRQPRRDGDAALVRLAPGDRVGLAFAPRAGLLLAAVDGEVPAAAHDPAVAVEGAAR